jgi:AcrR family transcriptional regulator
MEASVMDAVRLATLKDQVSRAEEGPSNHPLLRTPAHQRISDAADWLFRQYGIRNVTVEQIAQRSATNSAFVLDYFGSLQDLVVEYLKRRVAEQKHADERFWLRVQKEHPKDEKQQLRAWVYTMAPGRDRFIEMPFTREAVDLLHDLSHPGRDIIIQYKTALRERIARLCCDALFLEHEALADTLLMLVEGAFIQRVNANQEAGERLIAAAEDLFKRH